MPAVESRSPLYNGNLTAPQDTAVDAYLTASTTEAQYLMPSQSNCSFTNEHLASLGYTGQTSEQSTDNVELHGFTSTSSSPFNASSSSNNLAQAYPTQPSDIGQFRESPMLLGTSTAHGLSPSTNSNIDHLSPDGFMNDQLYHDYNLQIEEQLLETQMTGFHLNENTNSHSLTTSYHIPDQSLGMDPTFVTTYPVSNISAPVTSQASLQLVSPSLTSNSSPVINNDSFQNSVNHQSTLTAHDLRSASSHTNLSPRSYSPMQNQQHSPALTNSSIGATHHVLPVHLVSPIVRVETYSGDESSSKSDISHPRSKRNAGSRVSSTHLSPSAANEFSDDDMDQDIPGADGGVLLRMPVPRSPERNDDGSWVVIGTNGQNGLSPIDRKAIDGLIIPTLEEQEKSRFKAEKDAEVQEWLIHSEVGSEAGEPSVNLGIRRKRSTNRRRAKSANDANGPPSMHSLGLGVHTGLFDDSGIPGPGIFIDERSELDEDEEGSDDYSSDDDGRPDSPPATMNLVTTNDETLSSGPISSLSKPWSDTPYPPSISIERAQPPTSNAAMVKFRQQSKDVDNASLAATVGSRRLSESDLPSLLPPDIVNSLRLARGGTDLSKTSPKEKRERRPSFLGNILPKRTNSNLLKRKGSHSQSQNQSSDFGLTSPKDPMPIEKPKRMGSWGRPKSPKLDTSSAALSKDLAPSSAINPSTPFGPWAQAKNAIRRSRSRSDISKSPGLAELMTQHGGPPMLTLPSQSIMDTENNKLTPAPSSADVDDNDNDDALFSQDPVIMDLKVRSDNIIPTYEGFKTHAKQLNPRLVDYMVERITQEQMRRYKRLLEFKVKHINAITNRNCSSGKFCTSLGGESQPLAPKAGNKDTEAPFIGFQITAPGSSDDDAEALNEGTIVAAQFPAGVPLPPVKRLPAEFECPLCFKVKKFFKPSDWTKHVHEDVQPFTCTFPNCGEPKSFKRKADWVRHENERHRQLENWTCNLGDCTHTCFRKDNFVQHLVREHKIPEPRARTGRTANTSGRDPSAQTDGTNWQNGYPATGSSTRDTSDDVWALVEECRHDTTKQPKDEPCRFCGNICNSWKKLTVHLAKHMEQISMPILPLVEAKQLSADTIISPVVELPHHQISQTNSPARSPIDNPRFNPGSSLSTGPPALDTDYGAYTPNISPSGLETQVMHSYPPPQLRVYQPQQQLPQGGGSKFADDSSNSFAIRSYPGLMTPVSQPGQYVNGAQMSSQALPGNNTSPSSMNRYVPPITPVSASYGQQPMFSSPVDTYFANPFTSTISGTQTGTTSSSDLAYNQVSGNSFPYLQGSHYGNQQQKDYTYSGH